MDGQLATPSEIGVRQAAQVPLWNLHENVLSPIRIDKSHEHEASYVVNFLERRILLLDIMYIRSLFSCCDYDLQFL